MQNSWGDKSIKEMLSENDLRELNAAMEEFGEVVLVRFLEDSISITFKDSQVALIATAKNSVRVSNFNWFFIY